MPLYFCAIDKTIFLEYFCIKFFTIQFLCQEATKNYKE